MNTRKKQELLSLLKLYKSGKKLNEADNDLQKLLIENVWDKVNDLAEEIKRTRRNMADRPKFTTILEGVVVGMNKRNNSFYISLSLIWNQEEDGRNYADLEEQSDGVFKSYKYIIKKINSIKGVNFSNDVLEWVWLIKIDNLKDKKLSFGTKIYNFNKKGLKK